MAKGSPTKAKAPKAAGGTKKEKKAKDPNAPKKPKSAYFFFMDDAREKVNKENPKATFGEKGKIMGAQWQAMSDKEKEKYQKQAAADKERYEKAMKSYKP